MIDLVEESDKSYWHQYVDFYDSELRGLEVKEALEFGVWRGASIRWLMNRFEKARIYGADIIECHASWPQDDRVKYFSLDQGDVGQLRRLFSEVGSNLDVVIEDGSHDPVHQRNCIVESISHIRSGGIYILEDLHTSHPSHPYYKKTRKLFRPLIGPLHALLALEHVKALRNVDVDAALKQLSKNSLFSSDDIAKLYQGIESIKIYKRTTLPRRCFACGGSEFDYASLKCHCGISLYAPSDSMSAVIRVK